eukprot:jgi/Mesvir1/3132/Mv16304-RA.1
MWRGNAGRAISVKTRSPAPLSAPGNASTRPQSSREAGSASDEIGNTTRLPAPPLFEYANFTARRDPSWNDNMVSIPHVLHRIFTNRNVTRRFREVLDKAGDMDPTLEFTLADFPTAESFMASRCGEKAAWAFRMLLPGTYKADFYRMCVLYTEGGYYMDLAMVLKAPMNSFVPADATFVVATDPGLPQGKGLLSGFLGSVPNHPLMNETMNAIIRHVEECWYSDNDTVDGRLAVTGPELLARAYYSVYGELPIAPMWNATSGVLLLPANKDESLTIHVHDLGKEREVVQDKFLGAATEFQQMGYMVPSAEHYSVVWKRRKVYPPSLRPQQDVNEPSGTKTAQEDVGETASAGQKAQEVIFIKKQTQAYRRWVQWRQGG